MQERKSDKPSIAVKSRESSGNVPIESSPITVASLAVGMQQGPRTFRTVPCDVADEGADFIVQVELPGVKREHVNIRCGPINCDVMGTSEPDIDMGSLVLCERGIVTYHRNIPFPAEVSPQDCSASLKDGLLTLVLPKRHPKAAHRRVPVE